MEFIKENKNIILSAGILLLIAIVSYGLYWDIPKQIHGYFPLGTDREVVERELDSLGYKMEFFEGQPIDSDSLYATGYGHHITGGKGEVCIFYYFTKAGKLYRTEIQFRLGDSMSMEEKNYIYERIYRTMKRRWGRPIYNGQYIAHMTREVDFVYRTVVWNKEGSEDLLSWETESDRINLWYYEYGTPEADQLRREGYIR